MSFIERIIDVAITERSTGKSWTICGHRVQCAISVLGGPSADTAHVRIFGLPLDLMNELTAIGPANPTAMEQNTMEISAGNSGETIPTVFKGSIYQAWADFSTAPDVSFTLYGTPSGFASLQPVPPTSFRGTVSTASVMASMASLAGLSFVNHGVSGTLLNPYFPGTALHQIRRCAIQAHVAFSIAMDTLTIWPVGAVRPGDVPVLSPNAGLVGYPTFRMHALEVRSVFLPAMQLQQQFEVRDSIVAPANGLWSAFGIIHNLESQVPGGEWFTDLAGWVHVNNP